jgi:hypothetical protein
MAWPTVRFMGERVTFDGKTAAFAVLPAEATP